MIVVGRLGQGREIGGLGKGQFMHRLVEIVERRRRDAVQVAARHDGAEEDLVEIEFEDLVLGEGRFHAQRDQRLADLARVGLLAREQKVLGHLLRDRRGALRSAAGDVGEDGARDALGVDAGVGVEVLVLGGEEGVDQLARDRPDGQVEPALAGVFRDQRAVGRMDAAHDGRLVLRQLSVIRQVLRIDGVSGREHPRADQEHEEAGREQNAEKPQDDAHLWSDPSARVGRSARTPLYNLDPTANGL